MFVVNLGKAGTIGRLPAGAAASEMFVALPEGGVGSAIRFVPDGTMFVADYRGHNIFAIPNGGAEPVVWFHSDRMLKGREPTNLAFGGSDGKTVFVTQRQGGFIESFRADREGREHCLQQGRC